MTTQNQAFRTMFVFDLALKGFAFIFLTFVIVVMALEGEALAADALSHQENAAIAVIDGKIPEGCHSVSESESFCVLGEGDVLTIEQDGKTIHYAVDTPTNVDVSAMIERAAFQRVML